MEVAETVSTVRVLCAIGSSLLMWGMLAVVAVNTNLEALGLAICIYSALLLCQTSITPSHVHGTGRARAEVGFGAANAAVDNGVHDCQSTLPSCSVCLEAMDAHAVDAPLYILDPCGHQLHLTCVIDLLRHNQLRCPLCRTEFQF